MSYKKIVFLNASVILAGFASPLGGSAKILKWIKQGKISGVINEIVADEATRHAGKIGLSKREIDRMIDEVNLRVCKAPNKIAEKYKRIVKDPGDIHLFTSTQEQKAHYLISLDKKHVLSLAGKIKNFRIYSPGEFIQELEN